MPQPAAPSGALTVGRMPLHWREGSTAHTGVLYYPARPDASSGAGAPPVGSERRQALLARRYGSAAAALLTGRQGRAAEGLVPAPGLRAALLFAPGAAQTPADYQILLEDLASHGFVVAALDTPDGEGDPYERAARILGAGARELARMARVPGQWNRILPAGGYGAFGHSVGGAAAVLALDREPLLAMAANLDGDFTGAAEGARLSKPVLYMMSQAPAGNLFARWAQGRSEARRDAVWRGLVAQASTAAHIRVRITGFYHANFLDAATVPPSFMPSTVRQEHFGAIDGLRGIRLTGRILRAFFVKPGAAALAPALAEYPEAILQ